MSGTEREMGEQPAEENKNDKSERGFRSSFDNLLAALRQLAKNTREYGGNFEVLTKQFLLNDKRYKAHFSKIELWSEWASRKDSQTGRLNWPNAKDIGIDLVATCADGSLCAIQCKFFLEGHITKSMLDSFISASGSGVFAERMFVATGGLSGPLEDALRTHEPPILCLNKSSFENSSIDWDKYAPDADYLEQIPLKTPRPYQETAINNVLAEFKNHSRGRLIMACGTGKTFTSLKIAEKQAGAGKIVLFCVPSLALLSQSLREWTAQSQTPIVPFAVCSDASAGRTTRKAKEADEVEYIANELDFPATTDARSLAEAAEAARRRSSQQSHCPQAMQVIFSTYHSMDTVADAQKQFGLPDIDLVICDEAHRTAGQSNKGEDKRFARILDADFIRADKRLFMTATPIVYTPSSKKAADERDITLYSMDNERLYGPLFHSISFSQAVNYGCLCDYKLLLLTVSKAEVAKIMQSHLDGISKEKAENLYFSSKKKISEEEEQKVIDLCHNQALDDATRMVGCYRALAKIGPQLAKEGAPMKSAIAFAQVIDYSADKVSSKDFAENFPKITAAFQQAEAERGETFSPFTILAEHIDGSMSGNEREDKLNFLKGAGAESECRILSNVRCLSEGVDVPALDAVLFLSGKNSQVEITQAVGRVMRTAPGKKLGYVILPVIVPEGQSEEEFLNNSDVWKTTYQVVQALRSHDAAIDNSIARATAGDFSGKIEIVDMRNLASGSIAESAGAKRDRKRDPQGRGAMGGKDDLPEAQQLGFEFQPTQLMREIFAKLADRCGTRLYWPQWAARFGKVAETLKIRIGNILDSKDAAYAEAQSAFAELKQALQQNISPAIDAEPKDREETLNILSAQAIAMPVFSSLFGVGEYDFPANNAVAKSLQNALGIFLRYMEAERDQLEALYKEIRAQLGENPSDAFRQSLIKDIYQNTIKAVYGEDAAKTVVYTPIEAVDFILRSVNELLASEFGKSFNDEEITVLEPFAGTGSFITRLLAGRTLPLEENKEGARFISPAALPEFYANRLWLNEINLLAYYAAIANIETTYHKETGSWQSFKNACLTDTFALNKAQSELTDAFLAENRELLQRQEKAPINVIIGNPPYGSEMTRAYSEGVDKRIGGTYAADFSGTAAISLYDGYIRAFRWATDRIQDKGIIAFITNGGFLDTQAMSGLRKHLQADFSSLYIFNLRGNANTQGELRKKESGGVFGEGSRAPVAISILVKNPLAEKQGQIYYHDIGDYLSRDAKLNILEHNFVSSLPFALLMPDKHYDWLNQRDDSFSEFFPLGDKKRGCDFKLFETYSIGINTARDGWACNFSKKQLTDNMTRMIDFYNHCAQEKKVIETTEYVSCWSRALKNDCLKGKLGKFQENNIVLSLYRPFVRSYLYFSRQFNEGVYQMPRIFTNLSGECAENLVIGVSGTGAKSFSTFISSMLPNLNILEASGQNFPLYLYEEIEGNKERLALHKQNSGGEGEVITDKDGRKLRKKSAITAEGLAHFRDFYNEPNISAEDIFYYSYGLLHSPEYREKYVNNLKKELPRIPRVKTYADFCAFSKAGRNLAELHLGFDNFGDKGPKELAAQSGVVLDLPARTLHFEDYLIKDKMRYGGRIGAKDKRIIHYNPHITIKGIPDEAHKYVINGRSAIDWVIDRWQIKTDKASGIVNDPNAWGEEHGDRAYPLKLLLNVISLSLKTQEIVSKLPALDLENLA